MSDYNPDHTIYISDKLAPYADVVNFAHKAHEEVGQRRSYTNEPYIVHPIEVAELVATHGGTPAMIKAAILHDVVEDTNYSINQIIEEFGSEVGELVRWLTDVSHPEYGNRKARKELDREHTAKAPPDAKTIKLADLISNTRSITLHDPNFAVQYMREKKELLKVLTEGNPELFAKAKALVDNYYEEKQ